MAYEKILFSRPDDAVTVTGGSTYLRFNDWFEKETPRKYKHKEAYYIGSILIRDPIGGAPQFYKFGDGYTFTFHFANTGLKLQITSKAHKISIEWDEPTFEPDTANSRWKYEAGQLARIDITVEGSTPQTVTINNPRDCDVQLWPRQ